LLECPVVNENRDQSTRQTAHLYLSSDAILIGLCVFCSSCLLSIQLAKNQCRCCYTPCPQLSETHAERTNVCQWYLKGRAEVITCITHKRQSHKGTTISAWSPIAMSVRYPKCIDHIIEINVFFEASPSLGQLA